MAPLLKVPPLREGSQAAVPLQAGGTLKEGVAKLSSTEPARREGDGAPPCAPTPLSHSVGEGLGVRATALYFLRRRSASRLTSPLPNASILAGSGTTS
jgi:hypothetical protein